MKAQIKDLEALEELPTVDKIKKDRKPLDIYRKSVPRKRYKQALKPIFPTLY